MKKIISIIFVSVILTGCIKSNKDYKLKNEGFSTELIQLKDYFHIPGLSVIIRQGDQTVYENYIGFADMEKQITIDSSTTIPMASLTKIFTGVLIMQLVESKRISLDEPINKYVSNEKIPDTLKIKHVLSHTSQGDVGQNFYYSGRFGWLTAVVEKAYQSTFEEVIQEKIIKPLGLKNTYLLKDSSQIHNDGRKIASPYFYEGETKEGFIDYGYSAAAGITSTVRDLAIFSKAMDDNSLMTEESKLRMFTPSKSELQYGYGIFSQQFNDKKLIWGYGQYDCYSSLFLKVPEEDITLVIAANNNLMSDPARLIYGDVTYSLFAISFLKNYVFDMPDLHLMEDENSLTTLESRVTQNNSQLYLKKLIAQSVAESFLAMYDSSKSERSKHILEYVFKQFPDYENYGDLTLMHNLSFLKAIALHRGQADFTNFDKQLKGIGLQLITIDNDNPYANYYLANYYLSKGNSDSTRIFYNRIINARNFSKNWYTTVAQNWIKAQANKN
jgi:CubicO group peptidase (beta-lactamase class C family)